MFKSLFERTFKLNAMLNIAKVELELISDGDMYLFFEKKDERGEFLIFLKDKQTQQ